jgi:5'-3' exoribonuclease 1
MGIIKFYEIIKLFRRKDRLIEVKNIEKSVGSMYIDFNSYFYDSQRKTYLESSDYTDKDRNEKYIKGKFKLEEELMDRINISAEQLIKKFKPSKNLVIAIDGVANAGKLSQQKGRRFKSSKENKNKFMPAGSFTPGTPIMTKIDKSIRKWLKHTACLPINTLYSSHLEPGEGEHKIFEFVRQKKVIPSERDINLICGNDSDLFILSILSQIPNSFIYRHDERFGTKYYNIDRCRKVVEDLMFFKGCDPRLILKDFSLLIFFAGNDFLPQFPNISNSIDSFEISLKVYKQNMVHLSTLDDKIIWKNYLKLFQAINNNKENLYVYFNFGKLKYPYPEVRQAVKLLDTSGYLVDETYNSSKHKIQFDYINFKRNWYDKQFKPNTDILKKIDNSSDYFNRNDIDNMCLNFLKTIQWNHYYYTKGLNFVSHTHFYNYVYTPLTEDLEKYMISNMKELNNIHGDVIKKNADENFNAVEQLMMVLPPQSIELIPIGFRSLYKKFMNFSNPVDFKILEPEGTSAAHETIALIPPIDPLTTTYIFEESKISLPKNLSFQETLIIIKKSTANLSFTVSDKILM